MKSSELLWIEEGQIEAPIKVLVERNARKGWISSTSSVVADFASVSISLAFNTPETCVRSDHQQRTLLSLELLMPRRCPHLGACRHGPAASKPWLAENPQWSEWIGWTAPDT